MPIKLSLRLPSDSENTYVFEFDTSDVLLGRGPQCDVQLPFPFISSHHLTILREARSYLVADTGSTNGSRLNDKRLQPDAFVPLVDGDTLVLGNDERNEHSLTVKVTLIDTLERSLSLEESSEQVRQMVWETLTSQGSSENARLEIVRGPDRGTSLVLDESTERIVVGRSASCDVVLTDPDVHDEHVEIVRRGYGFVARPLHDQIVRLSSLILIAPEELRDNARLELGTTELRFVDPLQGYLEELSALPPEIGAGGPKSLETQQLDASDSLQDISPLLGPPDRPPSRGQLKLDLPAKRSSGVDNGGQGWGSFELLIAAIVGVVVIGGTIAILLIFNVV